MKVLLKLAYTFRALLFFAAVALMVLVSVRYTFILILTAPIYAAALRVFLRKHESYKNLERTLFGWLHRRVLKNSMKRMCSYDLHGLLINFNYSDTRYSKKAAGIVAAEITKRAEKAEKGGKIWVYNR